MAAASDIRICEWRSPAAIRSTVWLGITSNQNKTMKYLIIGLGIVALVAVIALLVSIPVWLLWNWLMPAIFGLKTISWLQAFGLSVLCGLLFKSSSNFSSK
jgi:hypothetical protein